MNIHDLFASVMIWFMALLGISAPQPTSPAVTVSTSTMQILARNPEFIFPKEGDRLEIHLPTPQEYVVRWKPITLNEHEHLELWVKRGDLSILLFGDKDIKNTEIEKGEWVWTVTAGMLQPMLDTKFADQPYTLEMSVLKQIDCFSNDKRCDPSYERVLSSVSRPFSIFGPLYDSE